MPPAWSRWLAVTALVVAALAESRDPISLSLTGHYPAGDAEDYVYEDFDVPEGTTSIYVVHEKGDGLEMGCWDQRGHNLALSGNYTTGFRGWSGHSRSEFTITPGDATPGYIAGPIQPGVWSIGIGAHKRIPEDVDYEFSVELGFDTGTTYFEPSFAPNRILGDDALKQQGGPPDIQAGLTWYRGEFHTHTTYSDSWQTPQREVERAQEAGLSFFFSTEHNTHALNLIWGSMAPDDMLIGRGIEVTTRSGHWHALGLNWNQWVEFRYTDDDNLLAAVEHLQRHGGLASINHPYIEGCYGCDWWYGDKSYEAMDSLEVWNGPWARMSERAVEKWQELLVDGLKIPAIGGSDSHDESQIFGTPTTIVGASTLSTTDILDGVRKGRAYVVRDPGIDLKFTLRGKNDEVVDVGGTIDWRDSTSLAAVLETKGMPSGAKASFINEHGSFNEQDIDNGDVRIEIDQEFQFVRAEVRDYYSSMLGLTNPIWIIGTSGKKSEMKNQSVLL